MNNRQRAILEFVCKGLRNREIAGFMGIKERTVKFYMSQLFSIYDVTNRTELVGLIAGVGSEGSGVSGGSTKPTQTLKAHG